MKFKKFNKKFKKIKKMIQKIFIVKIKKQLKFDNIKFKLKTMLPKNKDLN